MRGYHGLIITVYTWKSGASTLRSGVGTDFAVVNSGQLLEHVVCAPKLNFVINGNLANY